MTVTQGFDPSTSSGTEEVSDVESTTAPADDAGAGIDVPAAPEAEAEDAAVSDEPDRETLAADAPVEDEPVEDVTAEDAVADDAPAEDEPVADALQEFRDRLHSQIGDWYVVHTYSGMEKRVKSNL
jgi:transcriptional antiterminator NusG